MAVMIPERPREYAPESLEGEMFSALEKLSDQYYVVHSFKNVHVTDNVMHEGETDFLVFHPEKGIICIEAKAGNVRYSNGMWCYSDGKPMKHGGPYNQASSNKWDLLGSIQRSALSDLQYRCKLLHAVWFPSVKKSDLRSERFPAEFDRRITMTMEALNDPQNALDDIFSIELGKGIKTELSESDTKRLLREIICPEFNIFPTRGFDIELKKITFHRLLKEQQGILNYLIDQRTAVINGAAGTGKTMIAVEKATRHANEGEKVLFLCYNVFLKDYLEDTYGNENIDYCTIAGFACSICHKSEPNYSEASERIIDMYLTGRFPYRHVIVDEGQDFGNDDIEEADILNTIYETVTESDTAGTFYVFYDSLQMIQSHKLPAFISEADCKLTLYKNCRNTHNIAITSLRPISERTPKLFEGAMSGVPAGIHYVDDAGEAGKAVKEVITALKNDGINDVVLLTCETENVSCLSTEVKDGKVFGKQFTTCRKYKGLEADAIILTDVGKDIFESEKVLRFYVGASRARVRLEVITTMNDEDCTDVLKNVLQYKKRIKKPKRDLAVALNAFASIMMEIE